MYELPTPFASFTFTSPLMRHRVPSRFNWALTHGSTGTIIISQPGYRTQKVHFRLKTSKHLLDSKKYPRLCCITFFK